MKEPSPTDSSWRMYALCYLVIALSAPIIVFPEFRLLPGAKLVLGLLFFVFFGVTLRRDFKTGALNLSVPEIYQQSKAGRRFLPRAIQSAAFIAITIAFWETI